MKQFVYKVVNHSTTQLQPLPFIFELAMEEYILEHPDVLCLDANQEPPIICDYEFTIAKGNKRYDLVVNYDDDMMAIVEIKRGIIDQNAYSQLLHYLEKNDQLEEPMAPIIGVLVGTEIENDIISKIESSKNLYAIVMNRFDTNDIEAITTEVYRPNTITARNYRKYTLIDLQGRKIESLGKGRLVYYIIKSYIESYDPSFEELQKEFPKSLAKRGLNSRQEIVRKNIFEVEDPWRVRYFKEPIWCSDGEIVISNQWGIGNIDEIIKKAIELGMNIK